MVEKLEPMDSNAPPLINTLVFLIRLCGTS